MANSARFWNFIAARYARTPVRDEASYREKLRLTQEILQPDWQVLEIACGTGSTALEHAPHVDKIRAIDIAPKMIEICEDKRRSAGVENITFEVADIDTVALPEGGFDAVLAMSILHLLPDREAVLSKIFDVLRPGGFVFSSTLCVEGSAGFVIKVVLPVGSALGLLPKVRAFPADVFVAEFERAGFAIEQRWQPTSNNLNALYLVARKPD